MIFDWNGTVMSDVERAVHATNAALKGCGINPVSTLEFQETFTLPMTEWLSELGVAEENLGTTEAKWNEGMQNPAQMRSGAADLIHTLKSKGVMLGVVTAANQKSLTFDIEAAQLQGVFDFVHSSVADKENCLRNLKSEEGRYLYVGDTAYDVLSARSAGYEAIAISGGYQSNARLQAAAPDHFAHSFQELATIAMS
ncbi:HAD family hydrolase [Corynebacterium sp. A21]|uniref:HAD family hydrolase n=1 Tax=Corynebacterium sp. A21 TaxID=3457318 RepID=UPI003FD18342